MKKDVTWIHESPGRTLKSGRVGVTVVWDHRQLLIQPLPPRSARGDRVMKSKGEESISESGVMRMPTWPGQRGRCVTVPGGRSHGGYLDKWAEVGHPTEFKVR